MPIVPLVLLLLAFGFIVYMLMSAPIPIHPWVKNLILGILTFALIVYLLGAFGIHTGINLKLT